MTQAKLTTRAANKELKTATKNEKTVREKIKGGDWGMMCLVVWFLVVVLMFAVDMNLGSPSTSARYNHKY